MPLKLLNVWACQMSSSGDASQQVNQDNDVNRIIEQLEEQTLESRKRLDNIREVEQENLKMNRALKKLYNELNREKGN